MAEGRILSKRISRSNKVADLSTDTARMFYSWTIPYVDVEGRMEADPRLMKADIAPLLDHITPEKIQEILEELHNVGLIILYESEDMQYLQIVKFDENQPNLRKDREKKSQIPKAPAESKPKKEPLRQDSGKTPAEVPHKINISKDNIREAKATPAEVPPVDNSPKKDLPFEDEKLKKELNDAYGKILNLYPKFKIQKFFQLYKNKHPKAIIHTFSRLIEQTEKTGEVQAPWAYCEKIITLENMNYNAADHVSKAEEFKKPVDLAEWMKNFSNNHGVTAP